MVPLLTKNVDRKLGTRVSAATTSSRNALASRSQDSLSALGLHGSLKRWKAGATDIRLRGSGQDTAKARKSFGQPHQVRDWAAVSSPLVTNGKGVPVTVSCCRSRAARSRAG
jgi:hypothetical protein